MRERELVRNINTVTPKELIISRIVGRQISEARTYVTIEETAKDMLCLSQKMPTQRNKVGSLNINNAVKT